MALDTTSVGQFMFSRPLVAGCLAGWLLGDARLGLGVGALLEVFALAVVPSGGARLDDFGTAAIVAVGSVVGVGTAALPFGLAWGLVVADVGGRAVEWVRHWNGLRVARFDAAPPTASALSWLHWSSVLVHALRGVAMVVVFTLVGRWGAETLSRGWNLELEAGWAMLLLAIAVYAGVLLHNWGGMRARGVFFAFGLAGGLALGLLL